MARPGEVVLRGATRSFEIRGDHASTIKGLLLGRRVEGPPPVPALRGVDLHVSPGETVGIVGRNGAGKTSTLRVLAGIVPLEHGEVACGGRVVSLLELGAGFSRDFSGRENIHLQGALYGFSRRQILERLDRIVEFSELGEFIDLPVRTYSTGMFVRLGFSIATHLDADTMLIDEVLAVGDEAFQRKCLRRISEQIAAGTTLVLVSHDPSQIERVCERVVVLDAGSVIFDGPVAEGLARYHRLMGTETGAGASIRPAGARAVEIADVELATVEARPGARGRFLRSGEPLRIELLARGRRDVAALGVALEIRSADGVTLFATRAAGPALAAGEERRLVYEIPRLPLLGGDYDLMVAAGDAGAPPGVLAADGDRSLRFAVAAEPGAEGIADLRGTWSTAAGVSR